MMFLLDESEVICVRRNCLSSLEVTSCNQC